MSEGLGLDGGAGIVPDADPRHDVLAALDAVRDGLEWLREAAARSWSLSEDELRESVAGAYATLGSFHATTLALVKVLDGRPEAVPGASPDRAAADFLQARLHLDPGRANADVRAAHVLDADDGELPEVGAALAAGLVTREHADACVRAVAKLPRKLLTVQVIDEATCEALTGMQAVDRWLARQAQECPVRTVKQLVDQLVAILDPDRAERFDEDAHLRRSFRLTRDAATGMATLRMTLTPADAALLEVAVAAWSKPRPATEAASTDDTGSEQTALLRDERTLTQRQYDAVVAAWQAGFTGSTAGTAGMPAVQLLVTATLDQLTAAGLDMAGVREQLAGRDGGQPPGRDAAQAPDTFGCNGSPPTEAPSRSWSPGRGPGLAALSRYGLVGPYLLGYLTCNAALTRVLTDDLGAPLDVGRTQRLATDRQRKALAVRDRGCGWPGCACPPDGADVHHLVAWQHGGPTTLDNQGMFCGRHHQMLHLGIGEARIIDGRLHVRLPAWMDCEQRWLRNTFHHSHETAVRIGQQLALALDTVG